MWSYIVRRIGSAIPVFIGATLVVFLIVFALPGDPVKALAGGRILPQSTLDAINARYNLDQPLPAQYLAYMSGVLHGDLGESLVQRRPVADILSETLPNTLRLALVALVFEAVIGVGAGIAAAVRKQGFLDVLVIAASGLVVAIPLFVIASLVQLVFGVELGWVPVTGLDGSWRSFLLPGLVLGSVSIAYVARLTRTCLVEALREPYVTTARSKGLPERRVVGVHALRNSLLPVITFLGIDFGFLLGGAVVVESVFNINGAGNAVYRAISQRDQMVIIGFTLVSVVVFLVMSLLIDIVYAWLDPRIRYD
jgi:ABC-type dipeptide/oligopeptide/nickel transport system permease component